MMNGPSSERAPNRALGLTWSDGGADRTQAVRGTLTIGRASDCDIRLPQTTVSRLHCRVRQVGAQLILEATSSTNGVTVNGQRVQRATLGNGEAFQIGDVEFHVVVARGVRSVSKIGRPGPARRSPVPLIAAGGALAAALTIVAVTIGVLVGNRDSTLGARDDAPFAGVGSATPGAPGATTTPAPNGQIVHDAPLTSDEGVLVSTQSGLQITIPPGAVTNDGRIVVRRGSALSGELGAFQSAGAGYHIELMRTELKVPARLEVPYDPSLVSDPSLLVLAWFDEHSASWVPVETQVDTQRHVLITSTTHFSEWNPLTWDWSKWAANLDATLDIRLADMVRTRSEFFEGCSESGSMARVTYDTTVIKGCVISESESSATFRVDNPHTFPVELTTQSVALDIPETLGPGESLEVIVDRTSPSPARVVGTIPVGMSIMPFFLDTALSAFPGFDALRSGKAYWATIGAISLRLEYEIAAREIERDVREGRYGDAVERFANLLTSTTTLDIVVQAFEASGITVRGLTSDSLRAVSKGLLAVSATKAILRGMDYLLNSAINNPTTLQLHWDPAATKAVVKPAAPTQASIKAVDSRTVQVTWTPGSADHTGFRVYGTGGTLLMEASAAFRSLNIAGFQPNTKACVNVVAFNSAGESAKTYAGCATTPSDTKPAVKPAAPTQASIKAVDLRTVQVTWMPGSSDQTGFRVYGTGGTLLMEASASFTSVVINGFQPNTQVCVNVVAFNSAGESGKTYAGCATTLPIEQPVVEPAAPTNVQVSVASIVCVTYPCPNTIVGWSDNANNEEGYRLYLDGALIASLPANATSAMIETGLYACIVVEAFNSAGARAAASVCDGVTGPPDAPSNVRLVDNFLFWDDNSDNEDGFQVFFGLWRCGTQEFIQRRYENTSANTQSLYVGDLVPTQDQCGGMWGVLSHNSAGASDLVWEPFLS